MSCLIFCFDPDIMHHETLKHIWGVKHNRNVGLYVGQLLKVIQYNYSEYQGERQIFMFREQIYIILFTTNFVTSFHTIHERGNAPLLISMKSLCYTFWYSSMHSSELKMKIIHGEDLRAVFTVVCKFSIARWANGSPNPDHFSSSTPNMKQQGLGAHIWLLNEKYLWTKWYV